MWRPRRLNYSFAPERIGRLKAAPEFQKIASSTKKGEEQDEENRFGSLLKGFIRFLDDFWDVLMDALSEEENQVEGNLNGIDATRIRHRPHSVK